MGDITIRKAIKQDAEAISQLVNMGEREGQLLPRSLESICDSIGDWVVATDGECVVGCGSLVEMGPTLSEVRSLAVAPSHRQHGLGSILVRALMDLAQERRISVIFALTRAMPFFEKLGFSVTVKEDFPEKVWRDCMICPVRNACDEVAVVLPVAQQIDVARQQFKAERQEHALFI